MSSFLRNFLFIFILCFLVVHNTTFAATISRPMSNSGLVGYWSFEEGKGNTKTYDRSGNGNNGTLTNMNTSTAWVRGATTTGQALNFDGTDDYVEVSNSSQLHFGTGKSSVSFWFKLNSNFNSSSAITIPILTRYTSDPENMSVVLRGTDFSNGAGIPAGVLQVKIETLSGGARYWATSQNSWTAGVWYHVVIIFDGVDMSNNGTTYINGIQDKSTVSGSATAYDDTTIIAPWRWGRGDYDTFNLASTNYFSGSIDEIRIYNRTLSISEIQRLYKIQKPKVVSGQNNTGLTAYWPLDEGSGTRAVDASFADNKGTLTSGSTWTDGKINGAVNFSGSNSEITTTTLYNNPQLFTISAWFKTTSASGHKIIGFQDTQTTIFATNWDRHLYIGTDGKVYFGWYAAAYKLVTSTKTLNDGIWHHAVGTYDGTTGTLYIDGVSQGTNTGTPQNYNGYWRIGGYKLDTWTVASDGYFIGQIDDVRVYNRSLPASEVKALYVGSKATVVNKSNPNRLSSGLVGYWTFDGNKTYGTKTYDSTSNGNTGTLTNGPVITIGKIGQALSFDGSDDWVNVPDSNSLDTTSDLTISVWEKAVNWTGQGGNSYSTLVKKNGNYILRKDTNSGNGNSGLKLYWWDGTNYDVLKVTTPSAAVWHHIVGIAENNTVKSIYVDGVLQSGSTFPNNTVSTRDLTNILEIGSGVSGTESFNGKIDDVRIYTRAISADEVKALYNMGR